jgi:vacuolar-type H+-ATPase subunit I/STV1
MQLCGLAVESNLKYSMKNVNTDSVTSSTSAGWLLFAGLWGVLILNFALAVSVIDSKYEGSVPTVRIPSWVWIVVFLNLVYYALFGIVQWYHIRSRLHSPNFSYNNVEYWYIILSYVSKLSLAAGVSYGLILRTKDCPQP